MLSDRGKHEGGQQFCGLELSFLKPGLGILDGECGKGGADSRPGDGGEGVPGYDGAQVPVPVSGTNLVSFETIRNRCSQASVSIIDSLKTYVVNCRIVAATPWGGEIPVTILPRDLIAQFEAPRIISSGPSKSTISCQKTSPLTFSCTVSISGGSPDVHIEVPLSVSEREVSTAAVTRTKVEVADLLLAFKVQTYGYLLEADNLQQSTGSSGDSVFAYTPTILPAFAADLPEVSSITFCNGSLFARSGPLVYVVRNGAIQHFAGTMVAERASNQGYSKRVYLGLQGQIFCFGQTLFVSSTEQNFVLAINIENGIVRQVAGKALSQGYSGDRGPADNALLNSPVGLAVSGDGNLLIADSANNTVRVVNLGSGIIDSLKPKFEVLGDLGFKRPSHVLVLTDGAILVSDTGNHRVVRVDVNGNAKVVAGSGVEGSTGDGFSALLGSLKLPTNLVSDGQFVYINDSGNRQIRRLEIGGNINLYSGRGYFSAENLSGLTSVSLKQIKWPDISALATDGQGHIFVASKRARRLFKTLNGGVVNFAGYVPATDLSQNALGRFWNVTGLAFNASSDILVVEASSNLVKKISKDSVSVLAGMQYLSLQDSLGDGSPAFGAWIVGPSNILTSKSDTGSYYISTITHNRIRKVDGTGTISTILGADSGPNLKLVPVPFNSSYIVNGMVESPDSLFVADSGNHKIIRVNLVTNEVGTFVGTGVAGVSAFDAKGTMTPINQPEGLAIWKNSAGKSFLVFSDHGNNLIKMVTMDGSRVFTIAGTRAATETELGASASLTAIASPGALAVWPDGTILVVSRNSKILMLKPTLAGSGDPQFVTGMLFGDAVSADCGSGVLNGTVGASSEAWSGALSSICPGAIYGLAVNNGCQSNPIGDLTTAFSQSLGSGKGSSMVVTLSTKCN